MQKDDAVSRQAAIDAADRTDYTGLAVEDVKKVTDEVVKEIKKLPSAQTTQTDTSNTLKALDCVERQAAIDALKRNTLRLTVAEEWNCEGHVAWDAEVVYSEVMEGMLLDLPSARPNLQPTCNQLATDCISRQAAIESVFKDDRNTTIKQRLEALPSTQPDQKWIPCSERPPEEYGEYICTMENGQVQECGFVPEKQKGLITGWSTCEADGHKFLRNEDVLAWMPLPAPYEGGREE